MKKKMPIGIEDFIEMLTDDYYYVDKTLMIRDLLDKKAKVNLFTRPRRFGKTLALSMLKYYFENSYDRRGNHRDYSGLFAGLAIANEGERYQRYMGQYPVISLSLKAGKQAEFNDCIQSLKDQIASEFDRHRYVLKDDLLTKHEKDTYEAYLQMKKNNQEFKQSLKFLSKCLEAWYEKKVIILIDEYDVPLENAFHLGYYDQMIDFIRGLFENTLKTNEFLEFAVITGCLRISKESIFTGLNNLNINSVLSPNYGEYFGFTEKEVQRLCEEYELTEKYAEMKEWYNGYLFGDKNVYNPWSCIKYMYDHMEDPNYYPCAYWVNTSSNSIVRDLIIRADEEQKQAVENLIAGGSITVPVHEDITYDEVYESADNLWNFMFFTGYLKKAAEEFDGMKLHLTLKLPNTEVKYIFKEKVLSWFQERIRQLDRSVLFHSVVSGDTDNFTKELQEILKTTISFQDFYENFYHGFTAGVLTGMRGYFVKSNRESGNGRSDIFIKPVDCTQTAYVIEFKIAKSLGELEARAGEAIRQIVDMEYERELYEDGYITVKRYGIAFFKKNCLVITG